MAVVVMEVVVVVMEVAVVVTKVVVFVIEGVRTEILFLDVIAVKIHS